MGLEALTLELWHTLKCPNKPQMKKTISVCPKRHLFKEGKIKSAFSAMDFQRRWDDKHVKGWRQRFDVGLSKYEKCWCVFLNSKLLTEAQGTIRKKLNLEINKNLIMKSNSKEALQSSVECPQWDVRDAWHGVAPDPPPSLQWIGRRPEDLVSQGFPRVTREALTHALYDTTRRRQPHTLPAFSLERRTLPPLGLVMWSSQGRLPGSTKHTFPSVGKWCFFESFCPCVHLVTGRRGMPLPYCGCLTVCVFSVFL